MLSIRTSNNEVLTVVGDLIAINDTLMGADDLKEQQIFSASEVSHILKRIEENSDKIGENEKDWDKASQDGISIIRAAVAYQGHCIERLVNDENPIVRCCVAKSGNYLDKLINDENASVVACVAEQGFGLDRLIHNPNSIVREAVARQGYELEQLISDPSYEVRKIVAGQGVGLGFLSSDPQLEVRIAVAEQGFDADVLMYDHPQVQVAIINNMDKIDNENTRKVVLDYLTSIAPNNEEVAKALALNSYSLDELSEHSVWQVREIVAQKGHNFEKLIKDERAEVRLAIAKQGYGLDILMNDASAHVRQSVAEQGYGIWQLIKDRDIAVRRTAAEKVYGKKGTESNLYLLDKDKFLSEQLVETDGVGLKHPTKIYKLPESNNNGTSTHE